MSPGYGWCYCCERPWNRVKYHITDYTPSSGCFPLCEGCWEALGTPEARMPYYRKLYEKWLAGAGDVSPPKREEYLRDLMEKWPLIEAAVLAEERSSDAQNTAESALGGLSGSNG